MRNGDSKRSAELAPVVRRASSSASKTGSKPATRTRAPVESWADKLVQQTREHPGRSVAMAVGVGYVLGGGLFSRLTARIVGTAIRIGLRTAVLPFVTEGLLALGQQHTTQQHTTQREDVKNETQ
jgi:hypothetical protein